VAGAGHASRRGTAEEAAVTALYNEHAAYPAAWLRNLIAAGHLPAGNVDERSIVDLDPRECPDEFHAFAGIGVWPYALRQAGWTGPAWTGSCPCQPFSSAGKGRGFADERHLWPAWFRLIDACRPPFVFGEQVASKDGLAWLDLVHADLEGAGYSVRSFDLCAAGFGAPHIRQRLFFVAYTYDAGRGEQPAARVHDRGQPGHDVARRGAVIGVADADGCQSNESEGADRTSDGRPLSGRSELWSGGHRAAHGLGLASSRDRWRDAGATVGDVVGGQRTSVRGRAELVTGVGAGSGDGSGPHPRGVGWPGDGEDARAPGPTNGFWRDAEWIPCRDGKRRPVEPGTFPLVDGAPGRVGKLRAYGNAIVAPVAIEFVRAVLEALRG